ncbi:reverse transcriptase domain-containing protein [Tanacetum coccineum]
MPRLGDSWLLSINLMPLSIWKKLSLPELTPTRMTLEVADSNQLIITKGLAGKRTVCQSWEISVSSDLLLSIRADPRYAPEFLGFPNSSGGNPTPTSEPFTSEFILEEIEAYLKDDSISPEIDHADFNPEEDICLIEKLLNNDPFQLPPMDLKQSEVTEAKSSIEEPPELELKDLPSHLEYAFLEENDKLPVIIAKGFLPPIIHQDFSKIARPMTHLLEKETPFVFSKDCIDAFQTLKKKLTEAPILVVPDWNLPFELMCDASDFAIGAVLGQRKMKHFQPIHYASKTMTEAQIHYTNTERNCLPFF